MGLIGAFKDTEENILGFHEQPKLPAGPASKPAVAKKVVAKKKK